MNQTTDQTMNRTSSTRWWALGATALSLLVVGLDMTILTVALPDIAVDLHASNAQLQWFADSYLLVLAAVMLPAGMIGDRFGRKPLTLGALGVFLVGSIWCAFAGSPGHLILGRVILGLGAAVLIPLAMSAVVVLFDADERPQAVMVLGLCTMLGLPLGPIAGGVLLQHFWWGSVFVLNIPLIACAIVAVALFLPSSTVQDRRSGLDLIGVLTSATGLVGITYGVIEAPTRGWGDWLVLATVIGGVLLLGAFLVWERRVRGVVPVFDYAIWGNRSFRWGAVAAAVASLAFFGLMFTLPQYFRAVQSADALGSGLRMLPMILGMIVAMRGAAALATRVPGRPLAAAGFAITAIGLAMGALTSVSDGFLRCAVWTTVAGFGFGVALFASQNTALLNLPRSRAATGSALVQTLRQVGSVLGIAVLGALLNDRYRAAVDTHGLTAPLAGTVRESAQSGIAVAAGSHSARLADSVAAAFVGGMDAALWVSAGIAVLGMVIALAFMTPYETVAEDAVEAESGRADPASESADARPA